MVYKIYFVAPMILQYKAKNEIMCRKIICQQSSNICNKYVEPNGLNITNFLTKKYLIVFEGRE